MSPFERPLRPSDVGDLIDLTVVGDPDTRSMADMQLEGVASLRVETLNQPSLFNRSRRSSA